LGSSEVFRLHYAQGFCYSFAISSIYLPAIRQMAQLDFFGASPMFLAVFRIEPAFDPAHQIVEGAALAV
jgi:hypothetical protein